MFDLHEFTVDEVRSSLVLLLGGVTWRGSAVAASAVPGGARRATRGHTRFAESDAVQ